MLVLGLWFLVSLLGCAVFAALGLWATYTGRTGHQAEAIPVDAWPSDAELELLTNPALHNEGVSK